MQKKLTKIEWLEVINSYKQLGSKEAVKCYIKFKKNIKYLGNLKIKIRKKVILFDNKGMKSLQRVKGSGRPKNWKDMTEIYLV
ncbi:hypothetical protein [Spiroplasma endosymbiont of Atherix ibis]|uniref:hypothetical protein n=1 Tax=Spiroplasma endosymbiont of Atherix ibis TaxID=3066291 RepID=UPI0030CEF498